MLWTDVGKPAQHVNMLLLWTKILLVLAKKNSLRVPLYTTNRVTHHEPARRESAFDHANFTCMLRHAPVVVVCGTRQHLLVWIFRML